MPENFSDLSAGMDPSGTIYEENGLIFRRINPQYYEFFHELINKKNVRDQIGSSIIQTTISEDDSSTKHLILEHEKISPANFPYEWPPEMLHDAARLTLDLCIKLLDEGLILKDATPWNILFNASRPVFVDFASIMPVEKDLIWVALDQFNRIFLFPLLAMEQGFGKACRSLFLSSQYGISGNEVGRYLNRFAWLKKPWLINRIYLPRMLVTLLQKSGKDKEIRKYIQYKEISPKNRMQFLQKLLSDLNSIQFQISGSQWSKYYEDIGTFFNPAQFNLKQKTVNKILAELKPKTVTDIGSNVGGYAALAAQNGAAVTAFDSDEDSISLFYRLVREKDLNILPLIMDVTSPSPQSGWRAVQYPSAVDRFRSEGALALALVHHLAITQGQSFARIVDELCDYCDKWLVTEFVPPTDPRTKEIMLTNRRDLSWYSLDNFLKALGEKFKKITSYDSYPEGRTLIVCEQKL